jgi:two-component system, cell cycle response regulator
MEQLTVKKIVLIDPEEMSVQLAERLNSVGFEVVIADSLDSANEQIRTFQPDLIIADIQLKSNNGRNIIKELKSTSARDISIVMIVPEAGVSCVMYGLLSGASDYIVKPYNFTEVYTRINTQFRALKVQRELERRNRELLEKNRLLEHMTITDSLTGLYNRRYILGRLASEISHASRYQECISFIMIDIDHFKRINDKFGHLAGDVVLRDLASHIRLSVRDVDIAARYGGEEFLVACPNTDIRGAGILAERIRSSIENAKFHYNDLPIPVTVSLGIRSSIPEIQRNVQEEINKAIGNADTALYKAKANGRNRVEVYMEGMTLEEDESGQHLVAGDQPM